MPCSKQWPRDCRWLPVTSAGFVNWCSTAAAACWCRRAIHSRWQMQLAASWLHRWTRVRSLRTGVSWLKHVIRSTAWSHRSNTCTSRNWPEELRTWRCSRNSRLSKSSMCGIAGIVSFDGLSDQAPATAVAMRDVLTHRGPDEAGLHCDEFAALGHRRLSIVDLGNGQQPMCNEDGTIWIVFNGEIYNHAELRVRLESAGHQYRTHSDTETIIHAYEEWGDDCVRDMRGMFAFAIWDSRRQRLLLVRDRLGVKPLYYHVDGNTITFGSEIKALLQHPDVRRDWNPAALDAFLAFQY